MKKYLTRKRQGAFAFEYIIVMVLFMAAMIVAFKLVSPVISKSTQDMNAYISGCDSSSQNLDCPR